MLILRCKKLMLASGLILSACAALEAEGADLDLDWYGLDSDLSKELLQTGLKKALLKPAENNTKGLLRKFNLSARAGDGAVLEQTSKALSRVKPGLSKQTLSSMADFLIDKEQWQNARVFMEIFPQAEPGWGYVFVKHWLAEAQNKEEKEKIERWLSKQVEAEGAESYWLREKMRFRDECGQGSFFLDELKSELKVKADALKVNKFLEAAFVARDKYDLSFLSAVYMPELAFDKHQLAEKVSAREPALAVKYFRASLNTKFGPVDENKVRELLLKYSSSPFFSQQDPEQLLRVWSKQGLAEALRKSGDALAAQKVLLELSSQNAGKMPSYALTQAAGLIQSQTPFQPLEQMIKKAEPENKDNPDYWLGRARYYQGRKDDKNTIASFEQALSLSPAIPATEPDIFRRMQSLNDYCYYLRNTNRSQQATDLWLKEFDKNKDLRFRARILGSLWQAESRLLKPEDNRIWSYLSEQKDWDFQEQHIVQSLVQNSKEENRAELWNKLEKLAEGNPSRQAVLGFVMTRNHESKKAIAHLIAASQKLSNKDKKKSCDFNLFEAYLDTGSWQLAEKQWQSAAVQLTPSEIPQWYAKIAVSAARAGAKNDAMRIWRKKDALDRNYLEPISELAKFGLKNELLAYYKQMAKDEPSSSIPLKASKILSN